MRKLINWKIAVVLAFAISLFTAGMLIGAAGAARPKTIIHVVTVKWKADATDAQKKAAMDGVARLAVQIPGIKNAWLKQIRKQPPGEASYDFAWVFEFENQAAERAYSKNPARTEWFEKVYNPIRDYSYSNQFTND